jgi:hypothetical protein
MSCHRHPLSPEITAGTVTGQADLAGWRGGQAGRPWQPDAGAPGQDCRYLVLPLLRDHPGNSGGTGTGHEPSAR